MELRQQFLQQNFRPYEFDIYYLAIVLFFQALIRTLLRVNCHQFDEPLAEYFPMSTKKIITKFLRISIRSISTVFRGDHLVLNPRSEGGDSDIKRWIVFLTAGNVPKTNGTNENVLPTTLVGERAAGVTNAAVLPFSSPGTENYVTPLTLALVF